LISFSEGFFVKGYAAKYPHECKSKQKITLKITERRAFGVAIAQNPTKIQLKILTKRVGILNFPLSELARCFAARLYILDYYFFLFSSRN